MPHRRTYMLVHGRSGVPEALLELCYDPAAALELSRYIW